MTRHLTPEEFVDALERPLSAERQSHLAICRLCADELGEMRLLMGDVTMATAVPEPSPLFWDHLSARVREAVDAVPVPVRVTWWQASWRPVLAVAGVLGVIAFALVTRAMPTRSSAVPAAAQASLSDVAEPQEGDAMWEMIGTMASSMRVDDAREAGLAPGQGATDAAIESLTPAQRQALMKLLRAEMGSTE